MKNSTDEKAVNRLIAEAKQAVNKNEREEAAELLEEALTLDPNNILVLDILGFVRFFQQRYKDCETCCRKVLEQKPEHSYALSGLGMALSRQGQLEEGVAMLEKAMSIKPEWPEPYWDCAVVLMEAGDKERALAMLNRGIENAPASQKRFEKFISKIRSN